MVLLQHFVVWCECINDLRKLTSNEARITVLFISESKSTDLTGLIFQWFTEVWCFSLVTTISGEADWLKELCLHPPYSLIPDMHLSLLSCGAESSCRVMLTRNWWVWFEFTGRSKHHLQNIFPQRCSSCFSACQDSLAAHYKDSPANIHFSQRLPCLVIKLEVWECNMRKRATTVTCFKADAGRLWGSFCIMPFNCDGRC